MKIDCIIDLQYGSTGKGLLAGYLAEKNCPDVVVTCNMPNAGHTYIDSKGQKMIFKILPNGVVSPALKYVLIGPGAVFDMNRLRSEIIEAKSIGHMQGVKVLVHPNATLLKPEHASLERSSLSKISSTMQGSMAAQVHKMAREPDDNPTVGANWEQVNNPSLDISVADHTMWRIVLEQSSLVQAEGSQGFSLGINQRFYPYSTSRECTPHRMLSDMGLPHGVRDLTVWGTLRTYPIRVGNTHDGYSGGVYDDQSELTWEELGQVPEKTTVTQRVRRVFTFSRQQLGEALWHCRPDHIFLNFCNYMEPADLGRLVEDIDAECNRYGTRISLFGYGPEFKDVRNAHTG